MTNKFVEYLKKCSEIVAAWPEWKQKIIGSSVLKKMEENKK
jgi:hypothetical protein